MITSIEREFTALATFRGDYGDHSREASDSSSEEAHGCLGVGGKSKNREIESKLKATATFHTESYA